MSSTTQIREAALILAIMAMVASCSSKPAGTVVKATTTPAGSTVSTVAPTPGQSSSLQTPSGVSGTSTDTFNVAVSGAVSGQLQPGGTGFITCYGGGAPKGPGFEASISNKLSGTAYTLGVSFNAFGTAPVKFPPSEPVAHGHEVKVVFSADADQTTKWFMAAGYGSGTITLAGGNGQPVTGSIDGDLAAFPSGKAVHLTATFACRPQA